MSQMLTSRYKGRIHDIDVKTNHDRSTTDSSFNLLWDPVDSKVIQIKSMDKVKSCSHIIFQILGPLIGEVNSREFLAFITYPKAGPYASVNRWIRLYETFLVRVPKECPVVNVSLDRDTTNISVWVPCVDMSIKMNNGDWSIDFMNSIEDRKNLWSTLAVQQVHSFPLRTIVWSPPKLMIRGCIFPSRPLCMLRVCIFSGDTTGWWSNDRYAELICFMAVAGSNGVTGTSPQSS